MFISMQKSTDLSISGGHHRAGNESALDCPLCKDPSGLHHCEPGYDTESMGDGASPTHDAVVPFWCELCSGQYELRFRQHKGTTYLGWFQTGHQGKQGEQVSYNSPVEVHKVTCS